VAGAARRRLQHLLAACRRRLSRNEFAPVQAVYYDTAEATDAWLRAADLDAPAWEVTEEAGVAAYVAYVAQEIGPEFAECSAVSVGPRIWVFFV
jgi:hypothetical protein